METFFGDLTSQVGPGWRDLVLAESSKAYWRKLGGILACQQLAGKVLLPPRPLVFRALKEVDPSVLKVVILGQDPYHGSHQANGMCFAVNNGQRLPPSLRNILKELASDLEASGPFDPTLLNWARQGVLLLNTVLTVEEGVPLSHRGLGWELFTAAVLDWVGMHCNHVVFILWGAAAFAFGGQIDQRRHHVIHSAHPSPLSAHRGFLGSRPFSRANDYLVSHGLEPIQWVTP